jgi:hypothetical protein
VTPPGLRTAVGLSGDPARDRRWGARRLALEAAAIEAVAAFDAAGIPSILLKGPVTSARLYPDQFRPFVDIDLLVPPDAYERAGTVLRTLGYACPSDSPIARGFVRPLDGCQIDLHCTLFLVRVPPERLWQVLAAHRMPFPLHRATLTALDDAAFAFHIALHVTQTGAAKPKPQQDLERALRAIPATTWAAAWRIGVQLDAADALTAALRCGSPEAARLADQLGAPPRVRLVYRAMLRHRADGLRSMALLSRDTAPATVRRWLLPSAAQRTERLHALGSAPGHTTTRPGLRIVVLRAGQLAAMVRALAVEVALAAPAAARRTGRRVLPRRRRGSPS